MTFELAFGITTTLLGGLALILLCLHKYFDIELHIVPDEKLKVMAATRELYKQLGETKSYTRAWQLLREHKRQMDDTEVEKRFNTLRKKNK